VCPIVLWVSRQGKGFCASPGISIIGLKTIANQSGESEIAPMNRE